NEKYAQGVADPCSSVQGGIGARSLETGHHRALSAGESLSDLSLVGRIGPQESRRRPAGTRRLLFDQPRIDEPEFQLLPRDQHGLSQCLSQSEWIHRRILDDSLLLLVARLLRDDRRTDRPNLLAGTRVVPRRPEAIPNPGISVPYNAVERAPASHQSEYGVLKDAQGGHRPFRSDTYGAQGRRLRAPLCFRRATAGEFDQAAC